MIIGRNPGQEEDEKKEPFVGAAGKLLDEFLEKAGWSRSNCYITNTVKCFTAIPKANRKPIAIEIAACSPWLLLEIQLLQPQLVIAAGGEAIRLFDEDAMPSRKQGTLMNVREDPFRELLKQYKTQVFAIYHPSYILRNRTKLLPAYWSCADKLNEILQLARLA